MKTEYYLINPTGNITVLVMTEIPVSEQPRLAAELMKKEPSAEQVGFVNFSGKTPEIRMAGGELCGNAAMSAAALYFSLKNQTGTVSLRFLGVDEIIPVSVEKREDGYICTAEMPVPKKISKKLLTFDGTEYEFSAVEFKGITHLVSEKEFDKETAEKAVRKWCAELKTGGLGIMFFDEEKTSLTPLVCVSKPETLFWENSCASGSCAVGAYLSDRDKKEITVALKEPSGILTVNSRYPDFVRITGSVIIEKYSEADI